MPRPIRRIAPREPLSARLRAVRYVLSRLSPAPEAWLTGPLPAAKPDISPSACRDYRALQTAWRKALKWTDGLDHALTVMLASIASTKSIGDQLWIKVIGPASSAKSTLCEGLSVNKEYVLAKSSIRGFHSGFKIDAAGEQDSSLIAQLYDKTLVTKDGDTLLQSPNLPQILSEARDLYDCVSRTHYRNRMSKDYTGVRMTWILCGTSSLRSIDSSELGERFLDCVIMEGIDSAQELGILWRVGNKAVRNLKLEANGQPETQYEPELRQAMAMTGGYVGYLRENAQELLSKVEFPASAVRRCMTLGKFVAYMRARPSERQRETAERELGARLVSQLVRLAGCLTVVYNKTKVDDEILLQVRRVALDTARGTTLNLAALLHTNGRDGSEVRSLSMSLSQSDNHTRELLRFLRKIKAVESFSPSSNGVKRGVRYRLTQELGDLYEEVWSA